MISKQENPTAEAGATQSAEGAASKTQGNQPPICTTTSNKSYIIVN